MLQGNWEIQKLPAKPLNEHSWLIKVDRAVLGARPYGIHQLVQLPFWKACDSQ
jgi:hypothetical protein